MSASKIPSDEEVEDDSFSNQSNDMLQMEKGRRRDPVYEEGNLKFFPPVYVQRYETVAIILQDPAWKGKIRKVIDFGCAELGFFIYLKNMEGVDEILEVDIDSEVLERCAFKAAPLTADYLKTKGNKPLDVYILAGSIADYDDHLIGTDAVIAIEVIEHLSEEAFKNMPYNIFHNIKPSLAIFTTPNSDFNSLFPNITQFRHKDHRFEWSRKQFFHWTQEIIRDYPEYSVRFYGVGAGPEGTENLGCCTQMAVFQRADLEAEAYSSARDELDGIQNYKLIKHYKYPHYIDTRTTEEKIIHEIEYQINNISAGSTYYSYDNNESVIPLSLLKEFVVDLCPSDEDFRKILEANGMKLRQKDDSWFLVHTESEQQSSEGCEREEDWLNEEITPGIDYNDESIADENWDLTEDHYRIEDLTNFESARSIKRKDSTSTIETVVSSQSKIATKSTPNNSFQIPKGFPKLRSLSNNQVIQNIGSKNLQSVKSRIPRKRNFEDSAGDSCKRRSLYLCKPYQGNMKALNGRGQGAPIAFFLAQCRFDTTRGYRAPHFQANFCIERG